MSTGELAKRRAELAEAIKQMTAQRDNLTAQILRFEGAILMLDELAKEEEPPEGAAEGQTR